METDVIDHKGLPASQVVGQISLFKGNVVARAVRDGDRVYIIGVSGGVAPWNDRVEKFLDDFTPLGAFHLIGGAIERHPRQARK